MKIFKDKTENAKQNVIELKRIRDKEFKAIP
jgi:hypothetical protein